MKYKYNGINYNKIIFDVGANNGSSSIPHAIQYKDTIVFAFEPTPEMVEIIRRQTAHLPNYVIIQKAVSDYNGISQFNVAGNQDWGCSSLLKFSEKSKTEWPGRDDFSVTQIINVDVIRLDSFIKEYEIPKIDLLHIDTQGSDLNVLKGMGLYLNIVYEGKIEAGTSDNILYYNQNKLNESIKFLLLNEFEITKVDSNDGFCNEVNVSFRNIKNKKIKLISHRGNLISHRGNINGRIDNYENHPDYIDDTIRLGYDVEIDIWMIEGVLLLGHDEPQYGISQHWLNERRDKLWLHCKNIEAMEWFNDIGGFNYFWHEKDTVTLTSYGYIWAYPGKQPIRNSIAVMPEMYDEKIEGCIGVCSDYIERYR